MIKFPSTISLIGMAGAGKTSVGKALAEKLNYKFIDTDKVIEDTHKSSLQGLLEKYGYLKLREIEEKEVLSLSIDGSIISTGGSVVYGSEAMNFLNENSTIVYLEMDLEQSAKEILIFQIEALQSIPTNPLKKYLLNGQNFIKSMRTLLFQIMPRLTIVWI